MASETPLFIIHLLGFAAFLWQGLYVLMRSDGERIAILTSVTALAMSALFGFGCVYEVFPPSDFAARLLVDRVEWWSSVLPAALWLHLSMYLRYEDAPAPWRRQAVQAAYVTAAILTVLGTFTNLVRQYMQSVTVDTGGLLYPVFVVFLLICASWALLNLTQVYSERPAIAADRTATHMLIAGGLCFLVGAGYFTVREMTASGWSEVPAWLFLLVGIGAVGGCVGLRSSLLIGTDVRRDFFYSATGLASVLVPYLLVSGAVVGFDDSHHRALALLMVTMIITTYMLRVRASVWLDTVFFTPGVREERASARAYVEALATKPAGPNPVLVSTKTFNAAVRSALGCLTDPAKMATSPLLSLQVVAHGVHEQRLEDNRLNRAIVLKETLLKLLESLRRQDGNTGEALRYYNCLYYPYVLGVSRARASTVLNQLMEQRQRDGGPPSEGEQIVQWLMQLDEDTFHQWQFRGSSILAARLREHEVAAGGNVPDDILEPTEAYQKQVEDALWQAIESAEAGKRAALEAAQTKSEFLATISHEIRTPMNAIIGLAHLALQTRLTPKQYDYVSKIHYAGTSLLGIINEILDFSKIEAGKLNLESTEFSLDAVIDHLNTLIAGRLNAKPIEYVVDIARDVPPRLVGDPLRLGQLFTNLLNNAIKFTEHGEIRLQGRVAERAGNKVKLRFAITDTGIGMTEQHVRRLFHAFVQADGSTTRKYGGSGLGLAICKRLVDLMDGEIEVESQPGLGSTFTFTAWLGVGAADRSALSLPADLNALHVLVVDDNAAARAVLVELVRDLGLEVDAVSSAQEAITAVEQASDNRPYGLVLMDFRMPEMDGLEATRRLQSNLSRYRCPAIVIVSAAAPDEARDALAAVGLHAYLQKPVSRIHLVDAILDSCTERANEHDTRSVSASSPDLSGMRILLAEDNEINQQIAVELLEGAGAKVTLASNGQAAADTVLAADDGTFDVVLMDIQMPVMDGYEATARLRAVPRLSTLPIVAMTAHAMAEERERCLAAGMNGHISKPIDPDALLNTLARWNRSGPTVRVPATTLVHPGKHADQPGLVIPGIDTSTALRRLAGNARLYRSLLTQFVEQHARTDVAVLQALLAGNLGQAQSLAHQVKGVAGNLGAGQLSAAASALESAIMAGQLDERLSDLAESFATCWTSCMEAIRSALTSSPEPVETTTTTTAKQAVDALANIERMAAEYDATLPEYLLDARFVLATALTTASLAELEASINSYAFDDTRKMAKQLAERLVFAVEVAR